MIQINNINNSLFLLNGVEYPKKYIARLVGVDDLIEIVSENDQKNEKLLLPIKFSKISIDGVTPVSDNQAVTLLNSLLESSGNQFATDLQNLQDKVVVNSYISSNDLVIKFEDNSEILVDITSFLADVRVTSGAYNSTTKNLDFTLSDSSIISVPVSALLPVTTDSTLSGDGTTIPLKVEISSNADNIIGLGIGGKLYVPAISTQAQNALNNKSDITHTHPNITDKLISGISIQGSNLVITLQDGTTKTTDVTAFLADVRVTSGAYNSVTKNLDFTLSDSSIISVPVSALLPVNTDSTLSGNGATMPLKVEISANANNALVLGTDGKLYVASLASNIIVKYASTTNVNIATGLTNGTAFGGGTLNTDDLILLKDQTTASLNGVYIVPATGAASRVASMATGSDAFGKGVDVRLGNSAGASYKQNNSPAIVGTDSLNFVLQGQGVISEDGEVIVTGAAQSNTSATFVDINNSTFILPSAGKYEIIYEGEVGNIGNPAATEFKIVTSANVDVPNSTQAINGGNIASSNYITNVVRVAKITINTPTSFKMQWRRSAGSGTASINGTASAPFKISWKKIGGFAPIIGQNVSSLRMRMNPLTTANATTTASINGYVAERMLYNETTGSFGDKITYNPTTGAFIIKGGTTVTIKAQLNRVYNGGLYDLSIVQISSTGVATILTQGTDSGAVAVGGGSIVPHHRITQLSCTVSPSVDTIYALQSSGGWGLVSNYWGTAVFPTVSTETLKDWNYIEFTQLGSSPTTIPSLINRASVICRNKTTQSLPSNTWTVLSLWTEIEDATNSFDATTGTFTAPRTGKYFFSVGNACTIPANQYYGIAIRKNSIQLYNDLKYSGIAGIYYPHVSSVIELQAGDSLLFIFFKGGPGNSNDVPSISNSWVSIQEVNTNF
jgi:hypothetical protein